MPTMQQSIPDPNQERVQLSQALSNVSSDSEASDSDSESDADPSPISDSESDYDEPSEAISSTIIQEIDDGTYICLVCTCEIDRQSEIWSCQECYRVYDLDCIKDWAVRGSSTTGNREWRCPACNFEHSTLPNKFTCWCGRVKNPKPDSLVPFSCGNPCDAKYPNCVHSCSSVCHPGEHPQCGALGPVLKCHCGKHSQQLPCLATPYEHGWTCDSPCDVIVCPLGHTCSKGDCHSGFCGPCGQTVDASCYCGAHTISTKCSALVPKTCVNNDTSFLGATACDDIIVQYFDCKIHFEELRCQPLTKDHPHCQFSPDVVKSCYCGKSPAQSLDRTSCTDPMPECDRQCGKLLDCGCECLAKCHEGPCECFNILETKCSCGYCTFLTTCKAVQQGFVPKCHRKCTAMLNCRRHWHREKCCEFEQVALKRERETKKLARNRVRSNFDDQVFTMEPSHICTKTCNLMKSCGLHRCEALCHSGNCGVCLEASNEDLICNCGKTVVPAPVRCGTKLNCQECCVRPKECGHEQELHKCHDDEKSCPNCTTQVAKVCNCGSKVIPNVLCSVENVSCGKICKVKKECGHPCNRPCSKDCTDGKHASPESCQFVCRKIKNNCPHMCTAKCHSSSNKACDAKKCTESVTVNCMCGRISRNVPCGASLTEESKIGQLIGCDDSCALAKREEELRLAFNMGVKPPTSSYSADVIKVYRRQTTWCSKYESEIRDFLSNYQDYINAGIKPKKSLHLPPMTSPQRKFIHELAQAYKLYSESQDKEPLRSVFLCITEASVTPPLTLKQTVDMEDEIEKKKVFLENLQQSQIDQSYFNAILIRDVFFGVSKDDVESNVKKILESYPEIENPSIHWIKDSTFAFSCDNFKDMDKEKEDKLYILSKSFKNVLREKYIAFDCKMCMVDDGVTLVLKTDSKNVSKSLETTEPDVWQKNKYSVLEETAS
ncbi:hypothetical protein JCM33374_g5687 [Metschnikowia sp. JCM 33374]|nr:hypothetical protein JCM33374_g5687 [Metschnikowia sp. JCM 33374]